MIKKFILYSVLYYLILSTGCADRKKNENELLKQQNAVWSESLYFRGIQPRTGELLREDLVEDYARKLRKNNIKYAFMFSGPYGKDGHIPNYAFSSTAVKSVEIMKKWNPELVILPWIGGVQNSTVRLQDSVWVKNAIADTKRLVDVLGVSGVHIDFEYILPGNSFLDSTIDKELPGQRNSYGANVNSFHRKLRKNLPDKFISSVVACSSQKAQQWKRKTSLEELKELVTTIDQLSFLFYDTSINNQKDFQQACQEQLSTIKALKGINENVEYLMAIGTFVNQHELQGYRNLAIENIPNTLITIRKTMNDNFKNSALVDGIAIYCGWGTNLSEWQEIYDNWTGL